MSNSLYHQINPQNQSNLPLQNSNINNIKQLVNMVKMGNNPQQIIANFARQNPQVSTIMSMLSNSGMSPKQFFMQQASQMGVDPNQIINMLK